MAGRSNPSWRIYRQALIAENKWRATKNGVQGKLIDFGKRQEVPFRLLVEELLEIVDSVVDDLGSRSEIEYINTILEVGTSADRQLRIYNETGSLEAVVDMLIEETMSGC